MEETLTVRLRVSGPAAPHVTSRRQIKRSLEALLVDRLSIAKQRIAMILEETRMSGTRDMLWYIVMSDVEDDKDSALSVALQIVQFFTESRETLLPSLPSRFVILDAYLQPQGRAKAETKHPPSGRLAQEDSLPAIHARRPPHHRTPGKYRVCCSLVHESFLQWQSFLHLRQRLRYSQSRMILNSTRKGMSAWKDFQRESMKHREIQSKADLMRKYATLDKWSFVMLSLRTNFHRTLQLLAQLSETRRRNQSRLLWILFSAWRHRAFELTPRLAAPSSASEIEVQKDARQEKKNPRIMNLRHMVMPFISWVLLANERSQRKHFQTCRSLRFISQRLRNGFEALARHRLFWHDAMLKVDARFATRAEEACLHSLSCWRAVAERAIRTRDKRSWDLRLVSQGRNVDLVPYLMYWVDETRRRNTARRLFHSLLRAHLTISVQDKRGHESSNKVVSRAWCSWKELECRRRLCSVSSMPATSSTKQDYARGEQAYMDVPQAYNARTTLMSPVSQSPTWNSWWDAVGKR